MEKSCRDWIVTSPTVSFRILSPFFEKRIHPLCLFPDGTPATQINRIVSHPTMSVLVTAHEDKYIRIFDITTGSKYALSEKVVYTDHYSGQCTHSMLAHLDGVTSLSIDAAGFSLVSGSHDCSVCFWDLLGPRCLAHDLNLDCLITADGPNGGCCTRRGSKQTSPQCLHDLFCLA